MTNKNIIIDQFNNLIDQIKFDIDNTTGKKKLINSYRLKSISTALNEIKKINKNNISIDDLKSIKGVGKGTIQRVSEILQTGKLSEVKITSSDKKYLDYLNELDEVYGIGRITAYKLLKEHNIKSIEELKNKVNSGDIVVSDIVKKGLKYVGKLDTKIPRSDIDNIKDFLLDTLFDFDYNLFGTICGSYRRLKDTSGDVDMIIIDNVKSNVKSNLIIKQFIDILVKKDFIVESLTTPNTPTKYMGIFKWNNNLRRIDIRFIPNESYYYALLYFTGPVDFNRKMRNIAISLNYTLNEYGLFDENKKIFRVNSEKEIFDKLSMNYLTPDKRN
jgi:DNA polymerase/3'-5' exonuclease PolX